MNVYEIDTLVVVSSAFTDATDATGAPIDPTTVALFYRAPGKPVTPVAMGSLTHVGTGVFSYGIDANAAGQWFYKFQGSGNIEVTTPDASFIVQSSRLIPG